MDRTLNRDTYERLKQDIMKFILKPGEQVSAAKLAERYQVSRTPVREALVKLETEGLVDIFPQSKSVISRINLHRARQEWFIRSTLELGMVDAFFDKLTEQDIDLMDAYNRQMKEMMINNTLIKGESLPSIRSLAMELKISVITTKRAYEELEKEGLIYSVPGKGFYVDSVDVQYMEEKKVQGVEEELVQLIEKCKKAGISLEEVKDMVEILWE